MHGGHLHGRHMKQMAEECKGCLVYHDGEACEFEIHPCPCKECIVKMVCADLGDCEIFDEFYKKYNKETKYGL